MLLAVLVIMALSIPLTMAMLFATPLIVLADSDVVPALKTSFFACLKNILPFLIWSVAISCSHSSRRFRCSSAGYCSVPS